MTPRAETTRGGKNAPLEGLRAVAIFPVPFYHAGAPGMPVGWLGVDLFLVLSGFLITTLLLREHGRAGRIDLGNFWRRRLLRLVPAYGAYAAVVTLLLLTADPATIRVDGGQTPAGPIASIWTWTVDYTPLGGLWDRQYLTRHLWSLALEWQYHPVFPLVLVAILRGGWRWAAVALIPAVILLDATFDLPGHPRLTMNGRGIALLIGSAVAYCLFAYRDALLPWLVRLHLPAIAVAIACFPGLQVAQTGEIAGALVVLLEFWTACAIVIASFWYDAGSFGAALLSIPAMVHVGQISYGMYLWHVVGWDLVWVRLDQSLFDGWSRIPAYGVKLSLYVGFAVLVATASFRVIERPFLMLKRRPAAAPYPAQAGGR